MRSIVLEIPDWPVVAYLRSLGAGGGDSSGSGSAGSDLPGSDLPESDLRGSDLPGGDGEAPIAIVHGNVVVACSPAARAEGVQVGRRRRDAQARCPALIIVHDDPARDQREFLPAVRAIEEKAPGVQIVRPGLCALRSRGPARYYSGEGAAVRALQETLAGLGFDDVRGGVADGLFTAEQAARRAGGVGRTDAAERMRIIPPGESASFLAPLSVTELGDPDLADLLIRLGVRTLGAFAAFDESQVQARLGERGVRLRALAGGADSRPVTPRVPPPELERTIAFEPPLEAADQVAFAVRTTADAFIAAVDTAGLVCTEVRIELTDEEGCHSERVWQHPACFSAAEVVDRVRWQLEGAGLTARVARVRIAPEAVDAASRHHPGLIGRGSDERLHHALSRVQALLGHTGVVTPAVGGGRWLAERQVMVPWGDRGPSPEERRRPWPGSLPAPHPTTVFPHPVAVEVRAADGGPVEVDARGILNSAPDVLLADGAKTAIVAWTGPWPLQERQWDAARRRSAERFQVLDAEQNAWLLVRENGRWWAEGRYD